MSLSVNVDKKPMLPVVAQAIDEIFHQPTDPFWTGHFMDLFFDGIDIDCTSEAFEAKATCAIFGSGDVKAIKPGDKENFYKFSFFGGVSLEFTNAFIRSFVSNPHHSYLYIG